MPSSQPTAVWAQVPGTCPAALEAATISGYKEAVPAADNFPRMHRELALQRPAVRMLTLRALKLCTSVRDMF
jgi:hypothetical protein